MKTDNRSLLHLAAAALVLLSAAVCAEAQSRSSKRTRPAAEAQTPRVAGAPAAPASRDGGATTQGVERAAPGKRNARSQGAGAGAAPSAESAASTATDADAPRYFYDFKQPSFTVSHIRIEHDAKGQGSLTFERQTDGEPLVEPLSLSAAALQRIMALWDALRFLETDVSYQAEKQFPHLGTMRIGMARGKRERTAEFNWTNDRDASALVNEYRRAADQAMLVFEIGVALENQPLEMTRLLNRFDILLQRSGLSDPSQLVPLLRELNMDERVPLIARNQAERLLKKIEKQEKQEKQNAPAKSASASGW